MTAQTPHCFANLRNARREIPEKTKHPTPLSAKTPPRRLIPGPA
jgi:hypothetical protein